MNNNNLGDFLSSHCKTIIIFSTILSAICIVTLIIFGISRIEPTRSFLDINVAPSIASIKINGQPYHNGVYEFDPGNYTVEISADNFSSKTVDATVEKGTTTKISTFLEPKEQGMKYYEQNPADISALSNMSDPVAQSFTEAYDKKLSIRQFLPINASYDMSEALGIPGNEIYQQTITDGTNDPRCTQAFCLLASGYQLNQAALSEAITDLGYNIEDYEVIYDFEE